VLDRLFTRKSRVQRRVEEDARITSIVDARVHMLMEMLTADSQPNVHAVRVATNSIEPVSLNIKQMGYRLAQQLAAALPPAQETLPSTIGLRSSLSTQAAIESPWVRHWCGQLKAAVVYHRKMWELCFVLQALYEAGLIRPGVQGLGFGCGMEPLPSYFAANGIRVTATDLPPDSAAASGWIDTDQHASGLDTCYMPHLIDRLTFDRHVVLEYVDMNDIPDTLTGYDFCWSICALEHLGSIAQGLDFIENSLSTLRPGGLAVHTTEFNIRPDGPTIDNWPTVAFQRRHMEKIRQRLEAAGHRVAPFDFTLGDGPLDKFVDLPPWSHDLPPEMNEWLGEPSHLKLGFDGIVATCIGIIITKAPA
jgi:2-polyprenyl-3-methyl-5-hydroxy-6-metoxy-1,4-benzoquinol methylase